MFSSKLIVTLLTPIVIICVFIAFYISLSNTTISTTVANTASSTSLSHDDFNIHHGGIDGERDKQQQQFHQLRERERRLKELSANHHNSRWSDATRKRTDDARREEGSVIGVGINNTSYNSFHRDSFHKFQKGEESQQQHQLQPASSLQLPPSHLLATGPEAFPHLLLQYDTSGTIPSHPLDPNRQPNTEFYLKEAHLVAERMRSQWTNSNARKNKSNGPTKPFKFHVYQIPDRYIHGAFKLLEERWHVSFCNRHQKKTNYTNLNWRHAHSLFTADVMISKYLQFHESHTVDPNEADVFIIPMMTHVYNCAGVLFYAIDILSWVTQFPYYKLYNGHDHYFFWWRWGMHFKSVERIWKRIARYFPNANIISFDYLEIMGRNEWQDFSLALKPKFHAAQHWIVMPYPDFSPDLTALQISPSVETALAAIDAGERKKIFFFFAGTSTIGGIRRWIKRNCDAHEKSFSEGQEHNICFYEDFAANVISSSRLGIPSGYPMQMRNSLFCGHAAGDALSSRRPTSAILAGCIPVLICDLCLYAFEDVLDYSTFAVFVSEEDVINGHLMKLLEAIPLETIKMYQRNLLRVRHHFMYNISGAPSRGDALDTLVDTLAVRGRILRGYRRWWTLNHQLSVESNAYPKDPPPVKKYLRKGVSSAEEERNFNNL